MAATRARRLAALEARSRDDMAAATALMDNAEKARITALLQAGEVDEAGALLAQYLAQAGKRWQPGAVRHLVAGLAAHMAKGGLHA